MKITILGRPSLTILTAEPSKAEPRSSGTASPTAGSAALSDNVGRTDPATVTGRVCTSAESWLPDLRVATIAITKARTIAVPMIRKGARDLVAVFAGCLAGRRELLWRVCVIECSCSTACPVGYGTDRQDGDDQREGGERHGG